MPLVWYENRSAQPAIFISMGGHRAMNVSFNDIRAIASIYILK